MIGLGRSFNLSSEAIRVITHRTHPQFELTSLKTSHFLDVSSKNDAILEGVKKA